MAAATVVSIEEQISLHPHVPVELLRYVAGLGLTYAAWRERDLAWERRFWATPEKSLPIARDPLEDLMD